MSAGPTLHTFNTAVGDTFTVGVSPDLLLTMRLTSATALRGARAGIAESHEPSFSLEFLGPIDPVLPQAIYHFSHDVLGAHDIFIVPIGRDAEGTRYEAVFN
jgi:Domain of unknown function (DUF6916)